MAQLQQVHAALQAEVAAGGNSTKVAPLLAQAKLLLAQSGALSGGTTDAAIVAAARTPDRA